MSKLVTKQRLLMISDLWGWSASKWVDSYLTILSRNFKIVFYDSQTLGEIAISEPSEKVLHEAFVNGGIDRAAVALFEKERSEEPAIILAFSVGATIAWRAMSSGLVVKNLVGVSGTRLRYETTQPPGDIKLYFGEEDNYAPDENWYNIIQLSKNFIPKQGHELYKEKEFCNFIAMELPSK
ncbi:MAG: alpha/beta hydrolase [Saprospiraceae bacterium]